MNSPRITQRNTETILANLSSYVAYDRVTAAQKVADLGIHDEQVIGKLKELATLDDKSRVREAAKAALQRLGHEVAIEERKQEGASQEFATPSYLSVVPPAEIRRLMQMLQSRVAFDRVTAAEEIARRRIEDEAVQRLLRQVAQSDEKERVRAAAGRTMQVLSGKADAKDNSSSVSTSVPAVSHGFPNMVVSNNQIGVTHFSLIAEEEQERFSPQLRKSYQISSSSPSNTGAMISALLSLIILGVGAYFVFVVAPNQPEECILWRAVCRKTTEYYYILAFGGGLIITGIGGFLRALVTN